MSYLAEISEIYKTPVTKRNIRFSYEGGHDISARVKSLTKQIRDIERQKRAVVGIDQGIPAMQIGTDKRRELWAAMKSDPAWVRAYEQIIKLTAPDVDAGAVVGSIALPDWNDDSALFRVDDNYDISTGSLEVRAKPAHTYLTQLLRAGVVHDDSASISNALITSDELIVMGWRGGQSFYNIIMAMPAGSLEYHTGCNPLFETWEKEMKEETGLSPELLGETSVVARVVDQTTQRNSSLYVFRTNLPVSFAELQYFWIKNAADRHEHKFLLPFDDNNPDLVLRLFSENTYSREAANPVKPSATTPANVGTVLPPGAITVLAHYAQREGLDWAREAQEILKNNYRLHD